MANRPTKPNSSRNETQRNANAGSLRKVMDVLDTIMRPQHPPSAAQVSARLGLPRPTTNRIIGNLIRLGLLERDPNRRELAEGNRLLGLAFAVLTRAAQRGPRHQLLVELAAATEETCNLGTIVGGSVRYVDRVEAKWPLALRLEPGSEIPLFCTALGKLLLAKLPRHRREKYLRTMTLRRYTVNTITDLERLRAQLDAIANEDVAFDDEEYLSGVVGMAVPVPSSGDYPVLGIAVAAPSARIDVSSLRKDLPILRETAEKVGICYRTE